MSVQRLGRQQENFQVFILHMMFYIYQEECISAARKTLRKAQGKFTKLVCAKPKGHWGY